MIGKFMLAILVAMTINASVGNPNDISIWESNEVPYETEYSDDDYLDDSNDYEMSDALIDLAIKGADKFSIAGTPEEIQDALTEITLNEDLDVQCAYYGSSDGAFYIYPERELPTDYDFRERPVYLSTMDEEIYFPEPYLDYETNREIQTIAITVYDKNGENIIGVFGIDIFND